MLIQMVATWTSLCGINLVWKIKEITALPWDNTFFQACKTDYEAPAETTRKSVSYLAIQSRWKCNLCIVCIILSLHQRTYEKKYLCCSLSVTLFLSHLFKVLTLNNLSLWRTTLPSCGKSCKYTSRRNGIRVAVFHFCNTEHLGTFMHSWIVLFHKELKAIYILYNMAHIIKTG